MRASHAVGASFLTRVDANLLTRVGASCLTVVGAILLTLVGANLLTLVGGLLAHVSASRDPSGRRDRFAPKSRWRLTISDVRAVPLGR